MEIGTFMMDIIDYHYFARANVLPRFGYIEFYHLNPFGFLYFNHRTDENRLRGF